VPGVRSQMRAAIVRAATGSSPRTSELLQWLTEQPGATWQERWQASGCDAAGAAWREVPARWFHDRGPSGAWREATLVEALPVAISADILRPSLNWLVSGGPARGGLLVRTMASARDPEGFARIAARDGQVGVTGTTGSQLRYRAAQIVAAKGGDVAAITVGDVAAQWAAGADRALLLALGAIPDPLTGQVHPPSEATIRRMACRVDREAVEAVAAAWTADRLDRPSLKPVAGR
jgi:hypothetical protein